MKKSSTISIAAILLASLICTLACKKKSDTTTGTGSVPLVVTGNYSNITFTTVQFTGNVTDDGGSFVTKRGFCWSNSNQNPSVLNDTAVIGQGAGSFSGTITGLKSQTNYYIRAYATNTNGTGYGSTYAITTSTFSIGLTYQGGIIFYIDGTGQHGLIAAANDQTVGCQWGCMGTAIGGTGTAIGTGQSNTTAIVNGCSAPDIAARICDNLTLNGYSDWYLPSKDELNQMCVQQSIIGGFAMSYYWSSSESGSNSAWLQGFGTGVPQSISKGNAAYMRAIRAF